MVSLKRYLDPRIREDADLREICCLLLSRMSAAAPVSDEAAYGELRRDIERLVEIFRESSAPEEMARTAEAAARVLEEYNYDVTAALRKQRRALRDVLHMTAETVVNLTGQNARTGERLREIGEQLGHATETVELPEVKQGIGDSLKAFEREIVRQQEELESLIIALRRDIECGPRPADAREEGELDAVTGLPQKHACVEAMRASIEAGKRRFVVVFVLSRLRAINLKFGRDVGDRVLSRFGEFLEQQMLATDRLYRWNGPTLVAVLDRSEMLDQIRNETERNLEAKREETLEVQGRSVMIPISADWSVFHLLTTVESAERQIDTFVAAQYAEEYV